MGKYVLSERAARALIPLIRGKAASSSPGYAPAAVHLRRDCGYGGVLRLGRERRGGQNGLYRVRAVGKGKCAANVRQRADGVS